LGCSEEDSSSTTSSDFASGSSEDSSISSIESTSGDFRVGCGNGNRGRSDNEPAWGFPQGSSFRPCPASLVERDVPVGLEACLMEGIVLTAVVLYHKHWPFNSLLDVSFPYSNELFSSG
jgi:hypothetical protein